MNKNIPTSVRMLSFLAWLWAAPSLLLNARNGVEYIVLSILSISLFLILAAIVTGIRKFLYFSSIAITIWSLFFFFANCYAGFCESFEYGKFYDSALDALFLSIFSFPQIVFFIIAIAIVRTRKGE